MRDVGAGWGQVRKALRFEDDGSAGEGEGYGAPAAAATQLYWWEGVFFNAVWLLTWCIVGFLVAKLLPRLRLWRRCPTVQST
jgi:hypothetical protein